MAAVDGRSVGRDGGSVTVEGCRRGVAAAKPATTPNDSAAGRPGPTCAGWHVASEVSFLDPPREGAPAEPAYAPAEEPF